MNVAEYLIGLIKKASGTAKKSDDEALREKIKEITNEEAALPDRPEVDENTAYERMSYDAPGDAEIEKAAEDALAGYRAQGEKSVESEIEALYKQYETEKKNGEASYASVRDEIDKAYGNAVNAAHNDTLKRGLARSSIASLTNAALEGEKAESLTGAAKAHADEAARLDAEIAGLETKRQQAFDDFNIAYTVKLTGEIAALKKQRDEKAAEVLKYNNSLTEKEYKDKLNKAETESKLYSDALAQKKAENALINANAEKAKAEASWKVYELLRENLASLTAPDAYNEIRKNPLYRETLTDRYYYKLFDEFGR